MTPDESRRLIDASGGNHAFALLLGLTINEGTSSRVCQWKRRGIPKDVLKANADKLRVLRGQATKRGRL